jgi:hypothetical protein
MGVSGFWFVLTVPDETVEQLRPLVDPVLERAAGEPKAQAEWQAWLEHPGRADAELFWNLPLQDGDWMSDVGESELVGSVSGRKTAPVAILFNGLGPERVRLLPGFLGNFLLSGDELRASRTAFDSAFALTPAERAEVLARMEAWAEAHFGRDEVEPEECLDLLPRAVEQAVSAGRGLFSVTLAY